MGRIQERNFAAVSLGHPCPRQGCLVSLLLLNAQLYDGPTPTTPPASAHSPDHLLTALIEAACYAA
jgi:hypothetical protein